MNPIRTKRAACLLLSILLCLSLLGGVPVFAAEEIWTEPPTGWHHWGHVAYQYENGYTLNWGVRGELARFPTVYAHSYYRESATDIPEVTEWCFDLLLECEGGTGVEDATESSLYRALHSFLVKKQTHETTYQETRSLYRYTDCMVSNSDSISSFYSGRRLSGEWDSGKTWNREHVWPNSKATDNQDNDIMMLRPTALQENSDRGNKAYGVSQGYYDPNSSTNGQFDLRGDVARILLYGYTRWGNQDRMWGPDGVIESLDVLLDWMEADPVDTWEMGRNDAVQSITGVRNCYVDYPQLAWALFGRTLPDNYPTPLTEQIGGFPPVSAPATLDAVPDDPAHGSVYAFGYAVECTPAPGYYASGYDAFDWEAWDWYDPNDVFRWDHGRLLFYPFLEANVTVVIHFTPIGEEDPCPIGHRWNEGEITTAPTLTEPGVRTFTCTNCGATTTAREDFRFADVTDASAYYFWPVYWAVEQGITSGTDAMHFSPKKTCTRAEVMSFLWKTCGAQQPADSANRFTDVIEGKYYYPAVMWALEHGVTEGKSETLFGVRQPCTRAEVVTFLWAAAGRPTAEERENDFTDVKEGKYYYEAVLWAVEQGITSGTGQNSFSPKAACTRAQIVMMLYRAASLLNP